MATTVYEREIGAVVQIVVIAIMMPLAGYKVVGLETRPSPSAHNDHLKPKLSLLLTFREGTRTVISLFYLIFYSP